jgi:hypothetical protein
MAKTSSKKRTSQKRGQKRTSKLAAVPAPIGTFPTQPPSVQIIFRGLQCFAFNGSSRCDVGTHNTTHGSSVQPHKLHMRKWEKTRTNGTFECPGLPIKEDYLATPPIRSIRIHVEQPDVLNGVFTYENGSFDRTNSKHDSRDFRWTLDLEGPDFFDVLIPNKRLTTLQPIVEIDNGLFFTVDRTESKFIRRHPEDDDLELNHIAGIIAANIYLKPPTTGSKVQVFVNEVLKDEIVRRDDLLYQLDVLNDCPSVQSCGYSARDFPHDEMKRNDFYLYYDNFPIPPGKRKLGLICAVIKKGKDDALVCPEGLSDVSDPSPCVGIVFGRTSGLR